jgi:phospholipid/cholesterol/gamma-HCH transport system substrate-binding protein
MDEAVLRFRVGVFVIFALVILGVLIFLNSEGWNRQYTVFLKPASAPGVTRGTPVRKNGILIGRVGDVKTQDDHVVLTLKINENERIFGNEICSIGSESFLGDAVVEILPLTKDVRGAQITDGGLLTRVSVKRNPLEIVDVALNLEDEITQTLDAIREAGSTMNGAGKGVQQLAATVQAALDDENSDFKNLLKDVRLMSQKAQTALDNFDRIFENINNVVGDPDLKGQVRDVVALLPEIFREIRVTIADTRETINSYRDVSSRASDNLENLQKFTAALETEGPEILQRVNASLKNTDGLIEKVGKFADSLEKVAKDLAESDGTIGKLLNDPALYDTTLESLENVRDLTVRLEPLVNDLRMFADSLARDPRQLGIKGALDKRPVGSGYKGTTVGRDRIIRQ